MTGSPGSSDGYVIQIDHVYPLARAWHEGAWSWTQRRRVRFANDVDRELLAVGARANQDKVDQTPAEWLPPWQPYRCRYLVTYLRVAVAYDLPVTRADVDGPGRAAELLTSRPILLCCSRPWCRRRGCSRPCAPAPRRASPG